MGEESSKVSLGGLIGHHEHLGFDSVKQEPLEGFEQGMLATDRS